MILSSFLSSVSLLNCSIWVQEDVHRKRERERKKDIKRKRKRETSSPSHVYHVVCKSSAAAVRLPLSFSLSRSFFLFRFGSGRGNRNIFFPFFFFPSLNPMSEWMKEEMREASCSFRLRLYFHLSPLSPSRILSQNLDYSMLYYTKSPFLLLLIFSFFRRLTRVQFQSLLWENDSFYYFHLIYPSRCETLWETVLSLSLPLSFLRSLSHSIDCLSLPVILVQMRVSIHFNGWSVGFVSK